MRRAFALIEMIVVIAIIISIMAMLLPGIATYQKKTDLYATTNVLQTVHDTQVRNARQFGSAGLVYGYTIYGRSNARKGVRPWVILAGGGTVQSDVPPSDIGRSLFWNANYIEFTDNVEPKDTADKDIYIEPRTGFVHAGLAPQAGVTAGDPLVVITHPLQHPNPPPLPTPLPLSYILRSKRMPYPDNYIVDLHPTGTMNIRGKR